MELFNKVSVSFFAFVFLVITFNVARLRLDQHNKFNKLFLLVCRLVLSALLLETVVCLLDGRPYLCTNYVLKLLFIFLYILPPLLAYFWMLFMKVLTGGDGAAKSILRPIFLIPAIINAVLSLLSGPFGLLFVIDKGNVYSRGPQFFWVIIITQLYLIAALLILFKRRAQLQKDQVAFLVFICVLPMLGELLQALFLGALLMWGFTAGALIVLYVYLQDQMIQIDGLTGVWTRRSFDEHMRQLSEGHPHGAWGVLFLDIDDFKAINDNFGHTEGDAALKTFAMVVKAALRQNDIVARLGGDEFAVLVEVNGDAGLRAVVQKIETALETYNQTSAKPYRLGCSIGFELYEASYGMDTLMEKVDKMMYEQKRRKKAIHNS